MSADPRHSEIEALYLAFNERDIDAVLVKLAPDVDWPNAWEGGRAIGHDAVRDYWTRQWSEIDPYVSPAGFATLRDGRVAVSVDQLVKDHDGNVIGSGRVVHTYTFGEDGLVTQMEVAELDES
jgi:nuclear transport factor 2 (NTF2) superfamily protein